MVPWQGPSDQGRQKGPELCTQMLFTDGCETLSRHLPGWEISMVIVGQPSAGVITVLLSGVVWDAGVLAPAAGVVGG